MSDLRFELDGEPVAPEVFRRAAIDPQRSVVVDACAGSGKTTLLVTRMVRALLEGAAPDQILAITFTRLAAHEMRERLTTTLRGLALADPARVEVQLVDWFGLTPDQAAAQVARARGLYEQVLSHPRGLDITTFHSWFHALGQSAPLSDAAVAGAELAEESGSLMANAWYGWLDQLRHPGAQALRADLEALIAQLGVHKTRSCLLDLLESRTDWALAHDVDVSADPEALQSAAARAGAAFEQLWRAAVAQTLTALQPMGKPAAALESEPVAAVVDALLRGLAGAPAWRAGLQACATVLAQGSARAVQMAQDLEALISAAPALQQAPSEAVQAWLEQALKVMLTQSGQPREWQKSAKLEQAMARAAGVVPIASVWLEQCTQLKQVKALVQEAADVLLNARLMRCGAALLGVLGELKRTQGVMDFTDLEAVALGMLRDPGAAAYVQCRMDRRYRHLLFDEFQDTSSLQWRVIADWLAAYAGVGAGERPSVFVVGDPKQSIYRFRRAEARVFEAAKALLRTAFDARLATTDTTRRNAPALVDWLNQCLPAVMPHYRLQATAAAGPGLVWRLPLVVAEAAAASEGAEALPAAYQEGLAIARAIVAAQAQLAAAGRAVSWGHIFILARSRSGFEWYERALREHGLPVYSDRRGGLLRALEVDDLRALLSFVRRPTDDLALAQVLASPLLGVAPAELGAAMTQWNEGPPEADAEALATGRSLWARMQAYARQVPEAQASGRPLTDWVARLGAWIELARRVPPHDLLDAVLAEDDALWRYAASVPPAQRAVVWANLHALLGHALDFDSGRCPSLARYLARLRGLNTLEDREGPDEGRSAHIDAIRLMTIHASKGLEADLVVLADAHVQARPEGARLFVDWSPEWPCPEHVSFVQGKEAAEGARKERLARAEILREREDSNLLYVALTRARHGLIVSGVQRRQALSRSWYTVLQAVPEPPLQPAAPEGPEAVAPPPAAVFTWRGLDLPRLGVGQLAAPAETLAEADLERVAGAAVATEMGHALHRALELWPDGHERDTVWAALQVFELTESQCQVALRQAEAVLRHPELAPAFAPGALAMAEFEIFDGQGQLRRIDRLAQVGEALWIIDYKWSVDAARRPDYVAQLAEYRALIAGLACPPWGPVRSLHTVLVDAKAGRVEWDIDQPGSGVSLTG